MQKSYLRYIPVLIGEILLMCFAVSCKKDRTNPIPDPVSFAKLGLYEVVGSTNRRIFVVISQVGSAKVSYPSVFDTGSTGMTIDANGILPSSMVSSSGIEVAGDSVNVNGITVTPEKATLTYGGIGNEIQEYGNLAYAPITIGDANGNVTTPRIPIFLYYKIINVTTGQQLAAHSNDVFGVGPGVAFASRSIASPLSFFKLPPGITNGFKLAMLNNSFSANGTYVSGLLSIGLTPNDINSSGFIMHPLAYSALYGYSPNINSTVTYNGKSFPSTILFDTGTPSISILSDPSVAANVTTLPANTDVSITTNKGFNYKYTTTASYNLTQVENTAYANDIRTIFSIDFFVDNEYLLDYTNHQIGLKNN